MQGQVAHKMFAFQGARKRMMIHHDTNVTNVETSSNWVVEQRSLKLHMKNTQIRRFSYFKSTVESLVKDSLDPPNDLL